MGKTVINSPMLAAIALIGAMLAGCAAPERRPDRTRDEGLEFVI
jgi:hypothetical protein